LWVRSQSYQLVNASLKLAKIHGLWESLQTRTGINPTTTVYCGHAWMSQLLGPAPTRIGSTTLDPTFESFTLLEPVSYKVNRFLWWKCLDCLDWNGFFGVQSVDTVHRCRASYLLAGPPSLWCLVRQSWRPEIFAHHGVF